MLLELGNNAVNRALGVFAPMFASYGVFMIVLHRTVEPDFAIASGIGVAAAFWILSRLAGWNLMPAAAMTAITYVIMYFAPVFDTTYGTILTLVLWLILAAFLAQSAATSARVKIKKGEVVLDKSVGHLAWTTFEFLSYAAFFGCVFIAFRIEGWFYAALVPFLVVFGLMMWWAGTAEARLRRLEAGAHKSRPKRR